MTSPALILIYGQDPALLETRRLVLMHAGFEVIAAQELESAQDLLAAREFDLLILCHSLSERNCQGALSAANSLRSTMRKLVLRNTSSECMGGAGDVTLNAFADPRTLIATVTQLVTPPVQKSQPKLGGPRVPVQRQCEVVQQRKRVWLRRV